MKTISTSINLKKISLYAFFCTLVIAFSACNKNNDVSPQINYSNLAGINATESSSTDFYINNARTNASTITPGQVIGYFSVLPTINSIDFRSSSGASFATGSVTCEASSFYSSFLGDGGVIVTLQDDRTAPQTGKARVRFLNISPFLNGAVDFGSTGASSKLTSGIAYKTASGYMEIDPSITSISVYNVGTNTPVLTVPVTLQQSHVYVFYVTGSASGTLSGKLLTQI